MLDDVIYADIVFRIRCALTSVNHKITKECSHEVTPEDFQRAVIEAIAEPIDPPKKSGGQPGNKNAKRSAERNLAEQQFLV